MQQRKKILSSLLSIPMPAGFRGRLESRLRFPVLSAEVLETLPLLETQVAAETLCLEMPEVKNGLSVPRLSAHLRTVPAGRRTDPAPTSIPAPGSTPVVKQIDFTGIRTGGPVQTGPLLSLAAVKDGLSRACLRSAGVRCPSLLEPSHRIGSRSGCLLPSAAKVIARDLSHAPHERTSLDLNALPAIRVESLARQAETLKNWKYGQAEVVALFRRVPVEILSKVRFSPEHKQLIYTLHPVIRAKRTRVHDLIAIRDRTSGEVQLIPECTNFQIAGLNA